MIRNRCCPGISGQRGAVLILALWAVAFLAVLAVSVGGGIRQKITALDRLESRAGDRAASEAGVKLALAVLSEEMENAGFQISPASKARRHGNAAEFSSIALGGRIVTVSCPADPADEAGAEVFFGVCDEQARININRASPAILSSVMASALGLMSGEADALARAVADWRDYGRHEAEGFFSDSYYSNLASPYEMKSFEFERPDELLLVKGMTMERYQRLRPYITVYGDGKINVNTSGSRVLEALGLDAEVVRKILRARRGRDGIEATADDMVFVRSYDIAADVARTVALSAEESAQIDRVNAQGFLGTASYYFSVTSRADNLSGIPVAQTEAVFNLLAQKTEYWKQK